MGRQHDSIPCGLQLLATSGRMREMLQILRRGLAAQTCRRRRHGQQAHWPRWHLPVARAPLRRLLRLRRAPHTTSHLSSHCPQCRRCASARLSEALSPKQYEVTWPQRTPLELLLYLGSIKQYLPWTPVACFDHPLHAIVMWWLAASLTPCRHGRDLVMGDAFSKAVMCVSDEPVGCLRYFGVVGNQQQRSVWRAHAV